MVNRSIRSDWAMKIMLSDRVEEFWIERRRVLIVTGRMFSGKRAHIVIVQRQTGTPFIHWWWDIRALYSAVE